MNNSIHPIPGNSSSSDDETQPANVITIAVQLFLSTCLFLVSILGNSLICFLLARFKSLRNVHNILVVDLVVVDLLNVVINGPLFVCYVVLDLDSFRGRLTAWVVSTLHVLFAYLTLTTMFLMMIERFLAIQFPFKYRVGKTKQKTLVAVLIKWLLSAVAVLSVYVPLYEINLGKRSVREYRTAYSEISPIVGRYLSPPILLASVFLYFFTRRALKVQDSRLRVSGLAMSAVDKLKLANRKKSKGLNTILIIIIIFCISYVPTMFRSAFSFGARGSAMQWLVFVLCSSLFLPSALNSLVYFGRVENFQTAVKRLWKDICENDVGSREPRTQLAKNHVIRRQSRPRDQASERRRFVVDKGEIELQLQNSAAEYLTKSNCKETIRRRSEADLQTDKQFDHQFKLGRRSHSFT